MAGADLRSWASPRLPCGWDAPSQGSAGQCVGPGGEGWGCLSKERGAESVGEKGLNPPGDSAPRQGDARDGPGWQCFPGRGSCFLGLSLS